MDGRTDRLARFAIVLGAALLFLVRLGALDVSAPDEPVYAEMAEEVRAFEHGPTGLVVLYLNDEPSDQKPPLYYWTAALFGAPGGRVTEAAARLPSALAGNACVWLVLELGTLVASRRMALLGAALLLTTPLFAHLARRAALDVVLTMLELSALYAFARLDRGVGRRATNVAWLHASLGLAVLDKGPVGLLLPLLVMVVYLAWDRRLARARDLFPPWAFALSFLPGLAWITAATLLTPPGWFHGAVVDNLYGRFFLGLYHPRPWYFFFLQFPIDSLPWTLLWPAVVWTARRRVFVPGADPERARAWRFLLAWVGVMFVFFSISTGKRGLYMLPAMPAATLLTGDTLLLLLTGRAELSRRWAAGAAAIAAAAAAVGARLVVASHIGGIAIPRTVGVALVALVAMASLAWRVVPRVAAAAMRVDAAAIPTGLARPVAARLGVAIAATFAFELWVFHVMLPSVDHDRSARDIALTAAARLPPGGRVGVWSHPPLLAALQYYGGRPVEELGSADELRDFLARGGRVIVAEREKLKRALAAAPLEIQARAWTGRRGVFLLGPAGDVGTAPPEAGGDSTPASPAATSVAYSAAADKVLLRVIRPDGSSVSLSLRDLSRLPSTTITVDGKAQEGPALPNVLQPAGVTDYKHVTLRGATHSVTLARDEVTPEVLLVVTGRGQVKLVAATFPREAEVKGLGSINGAWAVA